MWPLPDMRRRRAPDVGSTSPCRPARRVIVAQASAAATFLYALLIVATAAQDASHGVFTTIDLKACKVQRRDATETVWRCSGLPGFPLQLAEVDDRTFLSFGPAPEKRRASRQTLRVPNTLFPTAEKRATVEWRVALPPEISKTPPPSRPYAAIVRYFTARDDARGQVLVVSKISPTDSCQMALIDAQANPEALALARRLADDGALKFDCANPPSVHGAAGRSPM